MRISQIAIWVLGSSAFLLLAGCSGNGSQPIAPPGSPAGSAAALHTASVAVAGKAITSCPDERVYVSNYYYSDIEIYPKNWITSPKPCATIVQDTLGPSGISVDKDGNLYVSNFCCHAISVFPRNARSPSRTLVTAGAPQYAFVGSDGTVYSSESFSNQVEEFAPGAKTATQTISINNPWGVATDSRNNLYVVSNVLANGTLTAHVVKFAPGATTGTDLGLDISGPGYAFGIKIGRNDSIVVGEGNGHVDVFPAGATSPSRRFPTVSAFDITLSTLESKLYVASSIYNGGVAEYDFDTGAPLGTIVTGLVEPDGVAYDPPAPY
jgi:hypothetical protein